MGALTWLEEVPALEKLWVAGVQIKCQIPLEEHWAFAYSMLEKGTLEEEEIVEARFIKIEAAYEMLIDGERRRAYDREHHVNPIKDSQAWMEWVMKKQKAFDQRGDITVAAWVEQ
uniref:Chaperone DnaJ-domain superfamily protein n=1 Tax=Zea mays TaxID=4577 RepID=A0A804PCT5_MAIZE